MTKNIGEDIPLNREMNYIGHALRGNSLLRMFKGKWMADDAELDGEQMYMDNLKKAGNHEQEEWQRRRIELSKR